MTEDPVRKKRSYLTLIPHHLINVIYRSKKYLRKEPRDGMTKTRIGTLKKVVYLVFVNTEVVSELLVNV